MVAKRMPAAAPAIERPVFIPSRYRKWEDFGPPPALPENIPTQEGARAALKRLLLSPAQRKLADRLADLMGERGWCVFSLIAWEKAITMGTRQLRRARADLEQRGIVTYQPFGPEKDGYLDQPGNGWIWFQPLECWQVRVERRGGYRKRAGRPKNDPTSDKQARTSLISDQAPTAANGSNQTRTSLISAYSQQPGADKFDSRAVPMAPDAAQPVQKAGVDSNQERTNLSSPAGQTCPNTLATTSLPERAGEAILEGRGYRGEEGGTDSLELSHESSREGQPAAAPPTKGVPVLSEETQALLEKIAQVIAHLEDQETHLWSVHHDLEQLQKEPYRWQPGETPWGMREKVQEAARKRYKVAGDLLRLKRWRELISQGIPVDQAERIVDGKELYTPPAEEPAPEQVTEDEQAEDENEREWWPLLTTNEWRSALFGVLGECFYPGHKPSKPEHDALVDPVNKLLAARIRPEQVALLKSFFERQPTNQKLRGKWYPPRYLLQVIAPFKDSMDAACDWGEALPHLKAYRNNKPFGQALEEEAQPKNKRAPKKAPKRQAATTPLWGQA